MSRAGQRPALAFAAAQILKLGKHAFVFDSLGSDWHLKACADADDDFHNRFAFGIFGIEDDKTAVDLDAVKRQRAQMRRAAR